MKKIGLVLIALLLAGELLFAQHVTWNTIKKNKKGTLTIFYYPNKPFIYEENGDLKGIEYELMTEFKYFVKSQYNVELEMEFKKKSDLGDLYKNIQEGKNGDMALGGLVSTDNRKDNVTFSKPYFPDMHLLVSSENIPVARTIAEFREVFKNAKAVIVPHNAFSQELESLKKYLPGVVVENVSTEQEVYTKVAKESNYFTFVSLLSYIELHKEGIYLKRQQLFQKDKTGLTFALTRQTDWNTPVNAFLSNKAFQENITQILHDYLGEEVHELLLNLKGKDLISKEIELLTHEREVQKKELKKREDALSTQTIYKNIFVVGFVLILGFLFLLYSRYRYKQRVNSLLEEKNAQIQIQTEELIAKTKKLNDLNSELHIQNQKVTNSIQAAKSIQQAILPLDYRFDDVVKEHFVLFQPKDIVSGDFYWMSQVEHRTFLAVADCTGHGVPGAFMSMLGYALLNEIVQIQGVYAPETILELLHIAIKKSLKQDHLEDQSGMDICLVRIDKKWNNEFEVTFAGAKRPLYVVQNGKLTKVKGDRSSIGGWQHTNGYNQFQTSILNLKEGDLIYLSSDGYADTPNPSREKYGLRRLETFFEKYYNKELSEQKKMLEEEIHSFQQEMEQRDDITILGVKL